MSFDVYLQWYQAGEPAGMPRTVVRSLFPVIDDESEPDYWRVRYDDLHCCNMLVGSLPSNPNMVHSISVNRPCGGMRFWESVLELMRLGLAVLYFPGCPGPLVARQSLGGHLPAGMVEALGQPICVQSAEQIVEIIKGS